MVLGWDFVGVLYRSLWSHSMYRGWLADMDRIPPERMMGIPAKGFLKGNSNRHGNRFPVAIDNFKVASGILALEQVNLIIRISYQQEAC